jgi:hypothetical protein
MRDISSQRAGLGPQLTGGVDGGIRVDTNTTYNNYLLPHLTYLTQYSPYICMLVRSEMACSNIHKQTGSLSHKYQIHLLFNGIKLVFFCCLCYLRQSRIEQDFGARLSPRSNATKETGKQVVRTYRQVCHLYRQAILLFKRLFRSIRAWYISEPVGVAVGTSGPHMRCLSPCWGGCSQPHHHPRTLNTRGK